MLRDPHVYELLVTTSTKPNDWRQTLFCHTRTSRLYSHTCFGKVAHTVACAHTLGKRHPLTLRVPFIQRGSRSRIRDRNILHIECVYGVRMNIPTVFECVGYRKTCTTRRLFRRFIQVLREDTGSLFSKWDEIFHVRKIITIDFSCSNVSRYSISRQYTWRKRFLMYYAWNFFLN